MPQSTVPMSSTHEIWRVSVKNRAVLWVRAMRCCSVCSTLMVRPRVARGPSCKYQSRNDADRFAVGDERGAGHDHSLADAEPVFDHDRVADDVAEGDGAQARDLGVTAAFDREGGVAAVSRR